MTRSQRPGGVAPPTEAILPEGTVIDLQPLAARVADRYYEIFTDEHDRYGPAGREWCIHDNLYLLSWAFAAQRDDLVFRDQVTWLSRVLGARDYPLDRLQRDLQIVADVINETDDGTHRQAASIVREVAREIAEASP